jgi:type I restriction enzyme, S subunit
MSSEWSTGNLGDFVELKRGYDLPQAKRQPGGIPLVSSSGVSDRHNVAMVKGPGVVTGRYGTIGQVFYVEDDFWPLNTTLYVRDFKGNDRKFIHYFLKTLDFHAYSDKAAVPGVNRNHLHEAVVSIPPVAAQREIAAFLGALDDRITLLRETNATLEAIAQALFKSWFVDFDPVRAKMEGRAPEGMDEATAALFPDALEETELGLVPKGWRVGCIEDLCKTITNGGTPSRSKPEFWESGIIPWFKTGEFADGFLLQPSEFITQAGLDGSSVKLLPKDAVLMAIYAAPTVGRLGVLTEPATFNQACTGMVAKEKVGPWYLFWILFFGRDWFNSRANGAAQQNISKAIVAAYKVLLPPDAVLAAFHDVCDVIHTAIRENSTKSQTLATLRDTLLPRLISGQLRVDEIAAAVEL